MGTGTGLGCLVRLLPFTGRLWMRSFLLVPHSPPRPSLPPRGREGSQTPILLLVSGQGQTGRRRHHPCTPRRERGVGERRPHGLLGAVWRAARGHAGL